MQASSSYVQYPTSCSRTRVNTRSAWTSLQGASSSSRLIVRPTLSKALVAASREDVAAAARVARCPLAVVCLAVPSNTSDTTNAPGPSLRRGETVPYRWSWQDDTEYAATLELEPSAIAAAKTLPDLTALLQTAIAAAPSRAALTPAARRLLNAAVQRILLSHDPTAAFAGTPIITVGDAARLLEAYGAASSQPAPSPANDAAPTSNGTSGDSNEINSSEAPPPLLTSVLAYLCTPKQHLSSQEVTAVEAASAQELAELLWAISEIQEDLPWDESATSSSSLSYRGAASYDRSAGHAAGATASVSASSGGQLGHESMTTAAAATTTAIAASSISSRAAEIVAKEAPAVLQRAVAARLRDQDFLAPDLCRVVCALGSLSASGALTPARTASPSASVGAGEGAVAPAAGPTAGFGLRPELVRSLDEEIRYQLTEFAADFEAADLGRLISGMAGLRLGAAVVGDSEYRRVLMKAVYGKTRSLTDKAAVDFALSRLLDDDPEARSMHYDSRWTHEELRWLPRRERDKRRIIKEGWYRTKWGGWSPGGQAE